VWDALGVGAPSGTLTFLFTDIEGSTALWEAAPEAMRAALAQHDEIVRVAIQAHGGYVFATGGDGFAAAFRRAGDAVAAGVDAQSALVTQTWPAGAAIRVRMGLHTGEVTERDGDYFGTPVNQAARLMDLGHGGQVLCSAVTSALVGDGWSLVDLGEHRLRDLTAPQRVFQVGSGEFPSLRSLDALPGNLAVQLSSFVGRETDVAEVVNDIGVERLVTLTGPGGVGKTRLALQAAAGVAAGFDGGVWLVELAGLADGGEVPAAVAAVLGVAQQPGRSLWGSVCDACHYRRLLLVLDNAEHLLDPVADLVVELLGSASGVKVLVTSREALGVAGERIRPVRPLAVEDEALALFAERARAVRPEFEVAVGNAEAVVEVCRHLDGMPLAIELAAARVGSMTPAEIAGRLDERFRLLRAGRRTRVERHQTLRATIDWSYDSLDEVEGRVFAELAVFPASFTQRAAEAVLSGSGHDDAWEVIDALDRLVAKSLVSAADIEGVTRYQMLETVRHYAAERLAERGGVEKLRRAHAAWVVAFVEEEAGPGLRGPEEGAWVSRLAGERESVSAAVDWAILAGDLDTAIRIPAALAYHMVFSRKLGLADLPSSVLGMAGAENHPLYAEVAGAAAYVLFLRGETDAAVALGRRAVDAERPGSPPAFLARDALVSTLVHWGDGLEALHIAEELLHTADAWGDPWQRVHYRMVAIAMRVNQRSHSLDELRTLAVETLGIARLLDNPTALLLASFSVGLIESARDPAAAIGLFCDSLDAVDRGGLEHSMENVVAGQLCRCYAAVGDLEGASGAIRRGLVIARDSGSRTMLAQTLDNGGQALISLGRDQEGATLIAAATRGLIASRAFGGLTLDQRAAAEQAARERLGPHRYDDAVAEGAAMTPETAIAYTLGVLDRLTDDSLN
jgi:predicted ATPase/class 3 adenylate cyclase